LDDGLGEKKHRGLQDGGAVFVSRTAVVVIGGGGVIRTGVGVLTLSDAFFYRSGFPVLKEVTDRRKAQQNDADSNEKQDSFGS
jgi:hypothetical protein